MRQPDGLELVRTHGPATTSELAEISGEDRVRVYKCLERLLAHGEVTRTTIQSPRGGLETYWEAVE